MTRWNFQVADKLPKVVAYLRSPPASLMEFNPHTLALYAAIADQLEHESKIEKGCGANDPHCIVMVRVSNHPGWGFNIEVDFLTAIEP